MVVAPDVWLSSLTKKPPEDQKDRTNLTIYACLVSASLIFAIIRAYGFLLLSLRCSERLHDKMVLAILQAPVLFFDSNPVGRTLNRFSKDVGCLDELLPKTVLVSIQRVLMVFASIIIPTVTNPWLLFPVDCVGLVYLQVLLKDVQRTQKVRVNMPQSSLLSLFRDAEWTGHDTNQRKTKGFRGSVLQVIWFSLNSLKSAFY